MVQIPSPEALPPVADSQCESPIESAFLVGLRMACRRRGLSLVCDDLVVAASESAATRFIVEQQASLGGYRVDFVVQYGKARAVVECDGHAFHERTKDQAQHDRTFDRAFQRKGYIVARFTGREIMRNAEACAVEVLTDLMAREGTK